jgi:GxxExxY protein
MLSSKSKVKNLVYQINGLAIDVHKELGPGLLESVYQKCLIFELKQANIKFETELKVPVFFKGNYLNTDLRCDLLIEDTLVVELKTVDSLIPIHDAQLLTYLNLLQKPIGLLLNFKCLNLYKEGQKTLVNELFRNLKD